MINWFLVDTVGKSSEKTQEIMQFMGGSSIKYGIYTV